MFGNAFCGRVSGIAVVCALLLSVSASAADTRAGKLRLSLEFPGDLSPGPHKIQVRFNLENVSNEVVDVCLDKSWGLTVGGRGIDVRVDHPTCVQSLRLLPGDRLSSPREYDAKDLTPGTNRVNGWLRAVTPGTCDRYGCDTITLASVPMAVEVAEARP